MSKKLSPLKKAVAGKPPSPTPRPTPRSKPKASKATKAALESQLSQSHERLVVQAFTDICRESRLDQMISRAIESVKELLGVEAASCFLHDAVAGELLAHHGDVGSKHIAVPTDSGVVGASFASGRSEIVEDAHADPRFNSSVDVATGFQTRNILSVPVLQHRQDDSSKAVIAVLQALNSPNGRAFSADDVALLELLASLLSGALERAVLSETAQREKRKSDALLSAAMALHSAEAATLRAVRVMKAVLIGLECERASMLLVDEVHGELLLVCTDSDAAGLRMPIGSGGRCRRRWSGSVHT